MKRIKKHGQVPEKQAREHAKARRRGFRNALLRVFGILLAAVFILGAIAAGYALYYKTHYKITFYQEISGKIEGKLRLAVLSDIHNREYGEQNEVLLADLRALQPDLILFPGDMVIREQDDYRAVLELVAQCALIAPCYGVLGNHESERIYYRGDAALPEKFENAGLVLLRNAREEIRIGQNTIHLLGVEGTAYGFEEYGGREFMENTPMESGVYSIVMAHIPILFDGQLSDYDFDLGIAGHVHGGIVRLPFIGGIYSQEEGFFPKFTAGSYILDKGQALIISAGLGDSRPFPPRINNAPELVVIDINRG